MAVLKDFNVTQTFCRKLNGIGISSPAPDVVDTYSDAMSTDSDDMDIQQELTNLENVISLTRANIDALNAKFAGFQHPPAMYLKEYEDLTSKLHELERRLLELNNGRESPESNSEQCSSQCEIYKPHTADSVSKPKFLRAHLPHQQRTSVQVREDLTLRDALSKAMKLRNLNCEMCCAYLGKSNIPVNWDVDISTLDCDEITVKILDKFPIPTSYSHNFVRKTFFSLVFCESCSKLLFQGFYCRTCGYKFHQRCAAGVPSLCHQVCFNFYSIIYYIILYVVIVCLHKKSFYKLAGMLRLFCFLVLQLIPILLLYYC